MERVWRNRHAGRGSQRPQARLVQVGVAHAAEVDVEGDVVVAHRLPAARSEQRPQGLPWAAPRAHRVKRYEDITPLDSEAAQPTEVPVLPPSLVPAI